MGDTTQATATKTTEVKTMRDLTRKQFGRACARQGFRKILMWLKDTTVEDGASYGMIYGPKTFKPMYRWSLSRAIKTRDKDRQARKVTP